MKIALFFLLCLILIGMTSYSYAASWTSILSEIKNVPITVLLQLELRDINGFLITYIESSQIIGIAPQELNYFLDNQNQTHKEFFIKDDIKYKTQSWEQRPDKFTFKNAYSETRLIDVQENEFINLLDIRYDSFQSEPGDVLRIFWTVTRPVS